MTNADGIGIPRAPIIFVAMPFQPKYEEFWQFVLVPSAVLASAKLDRLMPADDNGLVSLISDRVGRSDAIIALISEHRPFVFLELGFALAARKPAIVIGNSVEVGRLFFEMPECVCIDEADKHIQEALTLAIRSIVAKVAITSN